MSDISLPKDNKDESPSAQSQPEQKNELNESVDNASAQESVESTVTPTSPAGTSKSDTSAKDTSLFSEDGTPPGKRRKGIKFEPQMLSDADFSTMVETMCNIKLKSSLFEESTDEVEDDQNQNHNQDKDNEIVFDDNQTDTKTNLTDQTLQGDQTDQNEEADSEHEINESNSDPNGEPNSDSNGEPTSNPTSDPNSDPNEVSQEQAQEEEEEAESRPLPDRVYLSVVTDNKTVHSFRVSVATKMAKLMGAYSLQAGIPLEAFQFFYRGKPVQKDDTASSLGLEWGDFIDSQTDQDQPQDENQDQD